MVASSCAQLLLITLSARAPCSCFALLACCGKVLGDNTDVLVAQLVERLRPGITSATDGLSSQSTDYIIAKLKDLLDGRDPVTGEPDTAADEPSRGIANLQVAEQVAAETAVCWPHSSHCLNLAV